MSLIVVLTQIVVTFVIVITSLMVAIVLAIVVSPIAVFVLIVVTSSAKIAVGLEFANCDIRYESLTHASPDISLGQRYIVSIDSVVEGNSEVSS
jgi:hypothetical protein